MNERKIQPDGLSEYHQNWRTGIDWNIKNEIWQQNTERRGGVSNGLAH